MALRKTYKKLTLKKHEPITFNSDMLLNRIQSNRRSLHGILHYDNLLDITNCNSTLHARFINNKRSKFELEGFYPEILMLSIIRQLHDISRPNSSIELCPRVDQCHPGGVIDLILMIRFYEYDDVTDFERHLYKYFEVESVENDG